MELRLPTSSVQQIADFRRGRDYCCSVKFSVHLVGNYCFKIDTGCYLVIHLWVLKGVVMVL